METIIGNLGALYKIARIDLTTLKREWEFLNDLNIYYKPLDARGQLWLSQKDPTVAGSQCCRPHWLKVRCRCVRVGTVSGPTQSMMHSSCVTPAGSCHL